MAATFEPPYNDSDYVLLYSFGDDSQMSLSVPITGMEEETTILNDTNPTPRPGVRVQVQVNSSLNLTYPITVAWTCNSGM